MTRLVLRTPHELIQKPMRSLYAVLRSALGSSGFVMSVGWGPAVLPCVFGPIFGVRLPCSVFVFKLRDLRLLQSCP